MSKRRATIFKCPKCGHKFGPGAHEKGPEGPNWVVVGMIIVLVLALAGLAFAAAGGVL